MKEFKHIKNACQAIAAFLFLLIFLLPLYAYSEQGAQNNYWIFFGPNNSSSPIELSPQALNRRLVRSGVAGNTLYDLPVDRAHIEEVLSAGAKLRMVSRWLNAISVKAGDAEIDNIRRLPSVAAVKRVASYSAPLPVISSSRNFPFWHPKMAAFDYGPSFQQISMLTIDSLHNRGFSGQNIIIGIMDTGFDTTHEVFSSMTGSDRVVATRNFIDGGDDVMGPNDLQRLHGTAVLSIIGGFKQGELIGSAYGSKYVLARTEILAEEIRVEEDYWVGAAEWMESLGVDIISSSLGYTDWYDTTQLDGHTAVITQAANIANSLGVIVVNSAGNEGNTFWRKVTPPADGDSVIAVGAVNSAGLVTSFSSHGPTADGRIKPDFAALGENDYIAIYTGGYGTLSGTSLSAPLLAGGIALLLEGHPQWDLNNIISNLKMASSNSSTPDNAIGWGIPSFVDAFFSEPYVPKNLKFLITPQPAHDSVIFRMTFTAGGTARLSVHDLSGVTVVKWDFSVETPSIIEQFWDGKNSRGKKIASGIYICILEMGTDNIREKLAYFSR